MNQAQSSQTQTVSNDQVQAVDSIRLITNHENLYKNLKFIFADSTKVLAELMQNARRAGAHKVSFLMDEQTNTLVIEDDGCGIQNLQTLLHNSESGWDTSVKQSDNPFGMGFLSTLYAADEIIIESRGKKCTLITEKVIAMEPMNVTQSDYIGQTRITLINLRLTLSETKSALQHYARGFSIPVIFNHVPLARNHAIDQLEDQQILSIGTALLVDPDIEYTQFYVQGLPIDNPLRQNCQIEKNVVHLDSTFEVKMPDRHALYDPQSHVDRIRSSMKTGWIEKLHSLKQTLPAIEFVALYRILRSYDQLALLNDVPYLPQHIVKRLEEEPTTISSIQNYRGSESVISKDDIDQGVHVLVYNLDTDLSSHQGLSMLVQTLIYENDWYYIKGAPLDDDHWLYQSKALDLEAATFEFAAIPKVSGTFCGNYVSAQVHIVDQITLGIDGQSHVITNPSVVVQHDLKSSELTIYLGETYHPSTALGQASNYADEFNDFIENSFDEDVQSLNNLRARLLGEAPSTSALKAAADAGLASAHTCRNSVSVLAIDSQGHMRGDSLASILALFVEHQQMSVDHKAIMSFISDVLLVDESTSHSAQLHGLNVWRDADSSSLDMDI